MHGGQAAPHEGPHQSSPEENVSDRAAAGDSAVERVADADLHVDVEGVEDGEDSARASTAVQHKQQDPGRRIGIAKGKHAIGRCQPMPDGQQVGRVRKEIQILKEIKNLRNFFYFSSESSSRRRSSSKPINTPPGTKSRDGSKNRSHSGTPKSREISPRVSNEEIPLENLNSSPSSRCSSTAASRSHTPSRLTTDSSNGSKEAAPVANGELAVGNSEETSFIAAEKKKGKGIIETV